MAPIEKQTLSGHGQLFPAGLICMSKRPTNRRINGSALEQIMRDVLDGMQDITRRAGTRGDADKLEILGIDKGPAVPGRQAAIIPFPGKRRNS
jgi:hypothetical protein